MDVLWHTPVNHRLVPFMNYSQPLCTCSTASSVRHCPLHTPSSTSSMAKLLSPIDMLWNSDIVYFTSRRCPRSQKKGFRHNTVCLTTRWTFCNVGKLSGNLEILTFWGVCHYLYIFMHCNCPSCVLRNQFCNAISNLVVNCHYLMFLLKSVI